MIPKVRHINYTEFTPSEGTKWLNYCGYTSEDKNWNDEWMRDESLFLSLPMCSKCLIGFKNRNGIEYDGWCATPKKSKDSKPINIKKTIKSNFYDTPQTLRQYILNKNA